MFNLLLLSLLVSPLVVQADFGATVGSIDSCPVFGTCPTICVQDLSECPTQCDQGLTLCPDGRCLVACETNPSNHHDPCHDKCSTQTIPCPKVDFYLDSCLQQYQTFYDSHKACLEAERNSNPRPFHHKVFAIVTGVWIGSVTVLVFSYTAMHRPSSPVILDGNLQAIGYKEYWLGTLLYAAVVVTIWAFQVILAVLVILYYVNQGAITVIESFWKDERQILVTFEVVWMVCFFWNLIFKWPVNLRSLFWSSCPLAEATHVAVFTPNDAQRGLVLSSKYMNVLRRIWHVVQTVVHGSLARLFSQNATLVHGKWTMCTVVTTANDDWSTTHFVHNFRRYNLEASGVFVPAELPTNPTIRALLERRKTGLSAQEVSDRLARVGRNTLEMAKPSFLRVVKQEFTQVYYTYQNFIMWTWMPLYYYYMAIIQTLVIVTGGLVVAVFRHRNETSLFKLTHVEGLVHVVRDSQVTELDIADLVPGDVVVLQANQKSYCDMVLVNGSVLVDESALTGESTPVAKMAIDPAEGDVLYGSNTSHDRRHLIQAGTTVLETSATQEAGHADNLAVVLKTGSNTTKGELLRDIFSYQRHQFKFDVEVNLVVMLLLVYAVIIFLVVFFLLHYTAVYGWFYGMYAVASVLPPLLPTVFTVSVGVSDNRLSKRNIACTNSEEILVAGKVKRAFFDKTGTLTKQGLEFLSAHSVDHWDEEEATVSQDLTRGMAVCHSLTLSEGTGLLIGNPVDRAMFASSGAEFCRNKKIKVTTGETVEVLKHFDFDHHRMTQSVIVKTADDKIMAFVKGSGESIQKLCQPDTMPADFNAKLRGSAKAGVYQISMAMKQLDVQAENLSLVSRDDIEKDLVFIGVVNFKNILREETPAVIEELKGGQVSCVMVTGDSVLTGICIAKESGIISMERKVLSGSLDSSGSTIWLDEDDAPVALPQNLDGYDLAVTGSLWESLLEADLDTANRLAEHILVFGRCTPVHKVSVVTYFVDRGWITLMCGDGGNDCGALKTAHVGIALSDAEASIVAPFTSLDKTISSVLDVLREGRCALASALASYKFMIMYGHLIVFLNVISAYYHIMLAEWCWVFIDGVWTISLGFTLPLSGAADRLAPSRPTASLLGPHTMASSLGVLFLHYLFTILSLITLQGLAWFQCRRWNGDDISNVLTIGDNFEAETLFLVVGFQFFASAMAFNFGYEFRSSWTRNTWLLVVLAIFMTLQLVITFVPSKLSCLFRVNCNNDNVIRSVSTWEAFPIQNDWNTTEMPVSYRITLFCYMLVNTLVVLAYEYYGVNGIRRRRGKRRREGKSQSLVKGSREEESDLSFQELV